MAREYDRLDLTDPCEGVDDEFCYQGQKRNCEICLHNIPRWWIAQQDANDDIKYLEEGAKDLEGTFFFCCEIQGLSPLNIVFGKKWELLKMYREIKKLHDKERATEASIRREKEQW